MRIMLQILRALVLTLLALTRFTASTAAQEVTVPDPDLNAVIHATLQKPNGPLTAQDLLGLTNLQACCRNIASLSGLEAARNLRTLILDDNKLTSGSFPNALTNLTSLSNLDLSENPLTDLTLPGGLTNLNLLRVENSGLTNRTLPAGLTRLTELRLGFNQLPSLTVPADMTNLSALSVFVNQLTNLTLPLVLTNLSELDLDGNQLTRLTLPAGLTKLGTLIVGANHLTSFTVPTDMTNLSFLRLNDNQLTNLTLPPGLNHLSLLYLPGNQLTSLTLPTGLTNLNALFLHSNQLTNLTLPPDVTALATLFLDGNPLTTFVLSESMAASFAATVATLRSQGVSVFTYPLAARLWSPRRTMVGAFEFTLTGPPGLYSVAGSADLSTWQKVGVVTNDLGSAVFTDVTTILAPRRFYRALPQSPLANVVSTGHQFLTMRAPEPFARALVPPWLVFAAFVNSTLAQSVYPRSRAECRRSRGLAKAQRTVKRAGPAQSHKPGRQPTERKQHKRFQQIICQFCRRTSGARG